MFSPLAATNCRPIIAHELRCHSSLTGLNLNGHVPLCCRGVLVAAAQVRSFFLGLSSPHSLDLDRFLLRAALLSSDPLVVSAVLNIFEDFHCYYQ